MSTLAKRTINAVGWIVLMTLVYVVVISGLVVRQFQDDEDERYS